MEVKASVREVAELIYGSGDLVSENYLIRRAEEGIAIHTEHQSLYKEQDKSEVFIDYEETNEEYSLYISGRIDGIIVRNKKTIIEEIKSTTKDLDSVDEETSPAHLAQAKLYAYFYALKNHRKKINVRLTYIHVFTKKAKSINFLFSIENLVSFFKDTIRQYIGWLKVIDDHENDRNKSIAGLKFPFDHYRDGQRELMGACYKTIIRKDILYAIAPTGVGKTIATLFASLKAINQKSQKVFYLTAKNLGKRVALKTVEMLMENGLAAKTAEITSKDNICLQETRDCDPEKCPYSKGYYNRVFAAVRDLHEHENLFSKEIIVRYALKHEICPFEFSLDASYYADIIICDYNYAFCPRTHLIRYFDEESKYSPILLVDEAHNLVSRSKDMYSGTISKIRILTLAKLLKETGCQVQKEIHEIMGYFDGYIAQLESVDYQVIDYNEGFSDAASRLFMKADAFINDNKSVSNKSEIIKLLMDILRFTKTSEYFDSDFVYAIEKSDDDILANIQCLDASKFILKTLKEHTVGSVFFSATLYPITYYRNMLTQNSGNYIRIDSPFDPAHLNLVAVNDVSTRYRDRMQSIGRVVEVIRTLGQGKKGNYIAFFPSYEYLSLVNEELAKTSNDCYIIQKREFTLKEREEVVNLFRNNEKTQIGLFVMGGMFAEGIDYIGDMLSGVVVIGTGLPKYGGYNNVVKSHFDEKFGNGFDFAYTYPGLSKVIQAVGRVIRTETDRGIAILIDDRFTSIKYQKLYPKEWSHMKTITDIKELKSDILRFWEETGCFE
jgi:DNA excision repair protein ERCC-2